MMSETTTESVDVEQYANDTVRLMTHIVGVTSTPEIITAEVSGSGKTMSAELETFDETYRLDTAKIMAGESEYRDSIAIQLYTPERFQNVQHANHAPGPQTGCNEVSDTDELPEPTHTPIGEDTDADDSDDDDDTDGDGDSDDATEDVTEGEDSEPARVIPEDAERDLTDTPDSEVPAGREYIKDAQTRWLAGEDPLDTLREAEGYNGLKDVEERYAPGHSLRENRVAYIRHNLIMGRPPFTDPRNVPEDDPHVYLNDDTDADSDDTEDEPEPTTAGSDGREQLRLAADGGDVDLVGDGGENTDMTELRDLFADRDSVEVYDPEDHSVFVGVYDREEQEHVRDTLNANGYTWTNPDRPEVPDGILAWDDGEPVDGDPSIFILETDGGELRADGGEVPALSEYELTADAHTYNTLRSIAADHDVNVGANPSKSEVLEALRDAREEQEYGDEPRGDGDEDGTPQTFPVENLRNRMDTVEVGDTLTVAYYSRRASREITVEADVLDLKREAGAVWWVDIDDSERDRTVRVQDSGDVETVGCDGSTQTVGPVTEFARDGVQEPELVSDGGGVVREDGGRCRHCQRTRGHHGDCPNASPEDKRGRMARSARARREQREEWVAKKQIAWERKQEMTAAERLAGMHPGAVAVSGTTRMLDVSSEPGHVQRVTVDTGRDGTSHYHRVRVRYAAYGIMADVSEQIDDEPKSAGEFTTEDADGHAVLCHAEFIRDGDTREDRRERVAEYVAERWVPDLDERPRVAAGGRDE